MTPPATGDRAVVREFYRLTEFFQLLKYSHAPAVNLRSSLAHSWKVFESKWQFEGVLSNKQTVLTFSGTGSLTLMGQICVKPVKLTWIVNETA